MGCPFGCAVAHRRRCSNERSAKHNRSPHAKAKRHKRDEEKKRARERAAAEGAQPEEPSSSSAAPSAQPRKLAGDHEFPESTFARGGELPGGETGDLQFSARILAYVRMVLSLIEARRVSTEEVLEMLKRKYVQHSLARERPVQYALRRLWEEAEKPP